MLARSDLHTVGIGHLACEQAIYSSNQSLCRLDILHLCVQQLGRNPSKERQHVLCAGDVTFCLALHRLIPHPLICCPITGNCSLCGERRMNSCGSSTHKRQVMSHRYSCSTATVLAASIYQRGNVYRFAGLKSKIVLDEFSVSEDSRCYSFVLGVFHYYYLFI